MTLSYIKVFLDWDKTTRALKDAEKGRLIDALIMHAKGEQDAEANLSGNERFVFPIFQSQIDRDNEEYSRFIDKQRSNGAKGGRPKKPTGLEENPKNPLVFLETQKSQDKDKEKEKDKDKKEKISTDVDIQKKAAVISLLLNDGTEYGVEQEAIEKWENLYPAVNVMQELRKMAGWLDANRTRRKTRRGIEKFINGWLAREQDKGGVQRGIIGTDSQEDGSGFDFSQVFKQPWERDDWEDS